jgi:3-carboxy-cis,cis-muconate cycloisomerase
MLSSAAMPAVCDDVACLQHMLDFEAALARAEAAKGVIPAGAAGPIGSACKAGAFDLAADVARAAPDACKIVRIDGLSGRLAGPDRSPARFT